jgi:hypothetical protein
MFNRNCCVGIGLRVGFVLFFYIIQTGWEWKNKSGANGNSTNDQSNSSMAYYVL